MLLIVHLASAQDPELPFRGGVAGGNASGKQNREVCSVLDGFNPFNGGRGSGMANFPVIQSNCQSVVNFSPFNGGLAGGMFYARDIRSACQSVSGFSAYSGGLSGGFEHRKRVYRNCEGPNSSIVRLEPQSVCEGDTILIVGTHLSRVDQVTFSNNVFTLDFLVVDSTEIRVKVPLGAVTGPVEVSGPDGTALSNTDLTISPLPEAAFSYSAIDGLKYAFSSASTNADAYFWDFGNGLTAQSANPEVEFESDGQYLITHIAYNDCGTDTTRELITISSVFTEKI